MSRNTLVDVQTRLLESIHVWYPELRHGKVSLVCVQEEQLRWSQHLVFEVTNEHGLSGPLILVKLLRLRDASGRTQDEARPPHNTVMLEYRALSLLYEHLGGNGIEGITAVRPLTYFSDIDALVVEYVPGRNLLSLLLNAGRPWARCSAVQAAVRAAHRGGRLLGALHQMRQGPYPRNQSFDGEAYCQKLGEKIETLLSLVSSEYVHKRLLLVQRAIHEVVPDLQENVMVSYLHHDFYPENLVQLPDGRVYTIDTTLHQVGPVEDDIAKFLIGIDTLKQRLLVRSLVIRDDIVDAIGRSFLSGYCIQVRFPPRFLLLSRLVALIQRWIEVLSILAWKTPSIIASTMQRTRINPFMLARLDPIWADLRKELQLHEQL